MRKAQCFLLSCTFLIGIVLHAQTSFPVNGVADERSGYYIFTNATIVKDAATTLSPASGVARRANGEGDIHLFDADVCRAAAWRCSR